MERGFLAREFARAPRFETTRSSSDGRSRESGFGEGRATTQSGIDDISSGLSQENVAFFGHDGFEPDYEDAPKKRGYFSKLDELLREESPTKRFCQTPKSPSPPSSLFRSLELEPEQQPNVSSAPRSVQRRRKTRHPRIQIQRSKNKENPSTNLRQATLTKYLPMRKTQNPRKSADQGACDATVQPSPLFPGLFTNAVAQSPQPTESMYLESPRPRLQEDFVVSIKLEPIEERFLVRLKYMFDSAVKKLPQAPPFPMGVQPFQSTMLEVQLDSTTSHLEHLILQQALNAGWSAARIFSGETAEPSRETPDWARLPGSLPGTFLKKLAEFLLHKTMLIAVPGASLNELCRLSEKLRMLGIPTKYTSERIPRDKVETPGTWLVSYDRCPDDGPIHCFDGVILPQGVPKWSGLPCGSLYIDIDPEFSSLTPRRTAFVDCRLEELIKRLKQKNVLEIGSKSLGRHGVDLCSGDLGVIFSHGNLAEASNTEIFTQYIRRVLRAASFFRFLVILRVSADGSMDRLEKITRFVEAKGIQSECRIQVADTRRSPVEETIQHFCEMKGDDLADFAFLTLRNSTLASIIDEGNPDQTPHATLVAALL